MDYRELSNYVNNEGVAFRFKLRLIPAGGKDDKVFPPTYNHNNQPSYAMEKRVIDGREVPCVLLDSVQSQANRMEYALLDEVKKGSIQLPIIAVDFSDRVNNFGVYKNGWLTTLELPHRLADAILRASVDSNGRRFRDTTIGKEFEEADIRNATALYRYCPTCLLFGIWNSTGSMGGLGNKFQRTIVSEIVGYNAVVGVKTSSRLDPTGIQKISFFEAKDGGYTFDKSEARMKKNKEITKKSSDVNLGNIAPSIDEATGGVTIDYATQNSVITFAALRRLNFFYEDRNLSEKVRTVIAALGIMSLLLQYKSGYSLRSRCDLVPEGHPVMEILKWNGENIPVEMDLGHSVDLFKESVNMVESEGLSWLKDTVVYKPTKFLWTVIELTKIESEE